MFKMILIARTDDRHFVVVTKVVQTGRSDRFLYHRVVGLPETEVRHSETQVGIDSYTGQFFGDQAPLGH